MMQPRAFSARFSSFVNHIYHTDTYHVRGGGRIRRIKTEEKAKFVAAVLGDRIDTILCLR